MPITTAEVGASIAANSITLAQMATLPTLTIIGNNTGALATPLALTMTEVATILPTSSASVRGVVTSTDWSTFNNKVSCSNASVTDLAVPVFDLTTGKIIKQTGITINSVNVIDGILGVVTGSVTLTTHLRLASVTADSATGSNATLSFLNSPIKNLNGSGLISIDMMPAGFPGSFHLIENNTGASVTINNDTGSTAANRFITGTGSAYVLPNQASIIVYYSSTISRWKITGIA